MRSRIYIFPVLVLAMVLGQCISGSLESNMVLYSEQENSSNQVNNQLLEELTTYNSPNMNSIRNSIGNFSISDTEATGILDPITVEQRGYYVTGNISARTDSGLNTASDLSLDVGNGWQGSIAELEVWDLKRLYVVNGSFDDGIPGQNVNPNGTIDFYPHGWSAFSYNASNGETEIASYDESSSRYVVVENQGTKVGPSGKKYDHIAGSYILWNQTVNNTPYSQNFVLSFDYLYLRGPLGESAPGNCTISVFVNNTVIWNQSLPKLGQRGVWYSTGSIPISVAGVASTFEFKIGLLIDETMNLNADEDYNNDGTPDGIANTAYITVNLDDISFTGLNPPSFEEVKFEFAAGDDTVAVTGSSGQGNASIINETYWRADPVPSLVTSNVSCAFEYEARLLSHRFLDSTWSTDPTKQGVHYTSIPAASPKLSFNTYVGTIGTYEEFTLNITHPTDWENATVFDPFLNDVTSQCTLGIGFVTIPESLLDILGWWKVELESYNYAKSIEIQKYEPLTTNWVPSTEFRSGNTTRAAINIGTNDDTPSLSDPVNITWFLPNGTEWSSESVYSPIAGEVNSSKRNLGPLNTSAGQWYVEVQWTNGTEIAHAHVPFAMYHSTTLTPQYTEIESEVGPLVTNFLTFIDVDNGEYLMDESAAIIGNWSGSNIEFAPNLLRNWWEGDFNTAHVGGGVFLVIVNSSLPYYDNATCQFTISCTYSTTLNLRDDNTVEIELQETYEIVFYYKYTNGTGISDASISFEYSGSENGLLNSSPIENDIGNYSINVTGLTIGTYSISISTSKKYHEIGIDQFTIIVDEIKTELTSFNGTIGSVGYLEESRLILRYTNSTGHGLTGATVTNVSVTPSSGLSIEPTQDDENGNYSIVLRPTTIGIFSILIRANLTNHETKYVTFTLNVEKILTYLTPYSPAASIAVDRNYTVKLFFYDDNSTGLENASILILNPPPSSELAFSDVLELGGGYYNITITPLGNVEIGYIYRIGFQANLLNYLNSTTFFEFQAMEIPTRLEFTEGASSAIVQFLELYELHILYSRRDSNENVTGALISISMTPSMGLDWSYSEMDNGYLISLTPRNLDTWSITITATKEKHENASRTFRFTAIRIDTYASLSPGPTNLIYGRPYSYVFSYLRSSNDSGIPQAQISFSGDGFEWFNWKNLGSGDYNVTLTPIGLGNYTVTLTFRKEGFEPAIYPLEIYVAKIPIVLTSLSNLVWDDATPIDFKIELLEGERDTRVPVTGATVRYIIQKPPEDLGQWRPMEELGDGYYQASFNLSQTGYYNLSISIEKINYEISPVSQLNYQITIQERQKTSMEIIIETFTPIAAIIIPVIFAIAAQRTYTKRKRKQTLEALTVKRRFDDLKNLIGIIVLHKSSGLPIYSKMLASGFDSSMISAFITAIRTFRSEIEQNSEEPEFDLIPISDIVRVVSTRSLICAFITVTRPTPTQSEKMIEFAKAVGFQFDDLYDTIPAEVLDDETTIQFEYHFDNLMDGKLLKKFRMAEHGKFPRALKCVQKRFEHLEATDGFDLDDLAAGVASCGLEEARAYKIIMDYIEKGTIIPLTPEEERSLELGWEIEEELRGTHKSTEAGLGDSKDSL